MDPGFVHRVRHLLLYHPKGLPFSQVDRTWQDCYHTPLVPSKYGHTSLYSLLCAVPDGVRIVLGEPEWHAVAVLTAAGAEELVEYVRSEILETDARRSVLAGSQHHAHVGRHVSYERVNDSLHKFYLAGR